MSSLSASGKPAESAVLVPVPEAEDVVGRYRARLDPTARQGIPAHITVLYPFVPPDAITEATLATLAAAVGSVSAFACEFARAEWFRDEVLWLAPRPDGPFRALTSAVLAAFPGLQPYGGAYDAIPHLTIGQQPADGVSELRAAEAGLLCALPIRTRVTSAWLMALRTDAGSWHTVAELPLAAS